MRSILRRIHTDSICIWKCLRLVIASFCVVLPIGSPAWVLGEESLLPKPTVLLVRPAGWGPALAQWKQYRGAEYDFIELDSKPKAKEIHADILRVAKGLSALPAAIVLCSDVAREVSPQKFEMLTPGHVLDTAIRLGEITTKDLCTDALFADMDDDGCPDVSIGRLPAKSPDELQRMLARSMVYESLPPGPWNDSVHVTAGVGGFGYLADAAIETVTRRFLTEGIPQHYRLNVTVASCTSTYCPDPLALRESYIDRINRGGLFWVYIGHGNVTELDHFQVGKEWLPIGTPLDATKFQCQTRPPIALMLACFTGAFDARVDSFSEHLLAQPSGPIAVIAGSRVTMPYGLSQLASEMINGCFRDQLPTLGQVVLQAKQRVWVDDESPSMVESLRNSEGVPDIRKRYRKIVTEMTTALNPSDHDLTMERREHVRLMNLLGDPLLKLAYPEAIDLQVAEKVEAGTVLDLRGSTPLEGKLLVEMSLVRDRTPEGVSGLQTYAGTEDERRRMQQTYEASNQLVVAREEIVVGAGPFRLEFPVPSDARGRYVISAYVYGPRTWAVASKRITIQRPK